MSFTPSVSDAEEHLQRILKGWRSRYKYIILLKHVDKRVVQFTTEWSRRPTPHEPLPSLRVSVEFSFLYDAKMWWRAGHTGPPPASVSFRIEHESLVHRGDEAMLKRNIDHHIQRHLHAKSEFARTHPLPLTDDQAEYFDSRAAYEPLAHVDDSHLGSFAQFAQEARREADGAKPGSAATDGSGSGSGNGVAGVANQVERELIEMFKRADFDQNGSLDPEEFEDLLLNSKWGFTPEDVSVVMTQHDANDDGKLVYSEFIPIAIDLVQAQRASAYAQTITTTMTEAAYRAALARIQASKDMHRAMDSGLSALDPADSGFVTVGALVDLLRGLDLELTDGEVAAVLARIRALNKAAGKSAAAGTAAGSMSASGASTPQSRAGVGALIAYKVLQDGYEDVLLESIQRHHLDQEASDVEIYLNALFKKHDTDNTGILDEKAITSVLSSNPAGISLSSTQIYAIIGDHKPLDGAFKYRAFARKAALMIYQLLDAESLQERSSMIKRSAITPIQLLGSAARARIEHSMRSKLREFDADGDGQLSPAEFGACMADTGLLLSASEVASLLAQADTDGDGMVSLSEFTTFAYETLLHLQRDAKLKTRMTHALRQKQTDEAAAAAQAAQAAQ